MKIDKKILFLIVFVAATIAMSIVGLDVLKNKIVNQVLEEIKRDYVPGPYSPGFNPDKISPIPEGVAAKHKEDFISIEDWNKMWENQRN